MRLNSFSFATAAALFGGLLVPSLVAGDPWDDMFEQPLVKWALEIGDAKSLPWGVPLTWNALAAGYDQQQVSTDALALLASDTQVLARMETLRRAIAYSQKDPRIAYQLLAALNSRVRDADSSGKPDALAWFDLGYAFEASRQAAWLKKEFLGDLNGYSLVMRAIRVIGDADPRALEMQFAAGLILLEPKGQHPYYPHFKTVVRANIQGSLLEKNLLRHLSDKFEAKSLDEMRKSRYLIR
jgi:hypothetical protein